LELVK